MRPALLAPLALSAFLAGPSVRAQTPTLPVAPLWATETVLTGLDSAFALAVDGQGRLVVGGTSAGRFALVRYRSDGELDSTFGTKGVATPFAELTGRSVVRALVAEPGGTVVAAGTTGTDGRADGALVRLLAGGAPDPAFGTGGLVRFNVNGDDRVRALLRLPDGYVVAGSAEGLANGGGSPTPGRGAFVARFRTDGRTASFGQNGVAVPDLRGPSEATALGTVSGFGTLVGAVRRIANDTALVWLTLDANGEEAGFPGGLNRQILPSGSTDGPVGAVSLSYGMVATASRSRSDVRQVLLRADGSVAGTRNDDLGDAESVRALAADADRGIFVAGRSGPQAFLLRQPLAAGNPDGATDGLAAPPQIVRYAHGGRPTGFEAVALASGPGRAYVAGWTAGAGNRTSFLVAAYALPGSVATDDFPADGPTLALSVAPVPVRGRAAVGFRLAIAAHVRLSVVDLLGREVAVLSEGARTAGAHTEALDAARLAPGLYLLRLDAGSQRATLRLPVVR